MQPTRRLKESDKMMIVQRTIPKPETISGYRERFRDAHKETYASRSNEAEGVRIHGRTYR